MDSHATNAIQWVNLLAQHLRRLHLQPRCSDFSIWSLIDTVDMKLPSNGSKMGDKYQMITQETLALLLDLGINVRSWVGGVKVSAPQFTNKLDRLESLEFEFNMDLDSPYEALASITQTNFPSLRHLTLIPFPSGSGESFLSLAHQVFHPHHLIGDH
ncbi:hypothetical protein SAMD00019534_044140 [Acytostelium subglobosum LB1]|uniref:hypothetical protein n=1 Tax=Acytostelium subglobosum LB1 TaxID=1410327 RepID=UPI000644C69D|nr:hypothetical protein SAMD00019534_044140 [Acytostelium subglobosum LB1]GAM21239.1 hypothetical protein SAMD00019534_044140 [Acytostelium subglobosum LB1]|eukprot:XP_012755358.1 hypothetical protein SAMD00019534_044140 [Acytostelium subglobosum LB1]